MRFIVGDTFQSIATGRQAVVAEIRDGGRAGCLRFVDNGQRQWVLWAQLHHTEDWLPIGVTTNGSAGGDLDETSLSFKLDCGP